MRWSWPIALLFLLSPVLGRDWHDEKSGKSIRGEFGSLSKDRLTLTTTKGEVSLRLGQLSPEDQAYARELQALVVTADKLGLKCLEITQVMKEGCLCRLAMQMSNGSTIYAGEAIYLHGVPADAKAGLKLLDQRLYGIGARTYHGLDGLTQAMRGFSLQPDEALKAKSLPQDVYEPVIEVVECKGLGFAMNESGLVLVALALVEGAASIDVDVGNNHEVGTVILKNQDLGVALIGCKGVLTPCRLAPRKDLVLGQSIYALSVELGSTGRSLAPPALSKGIVSKLGTKAVFEHDATRVATSLGGVVVSEKGDVVGVDFGFIREKGKKAGSAGAEEPGRLTECLRSDALVAFLKTVPKMAADRAGGGDLPKVVEDLRKGSLIVKVIKERRSEAPMKVGVGQNADPNLPGGWSLSKAGTRHNQKCRYYNAKLGCVATDGTPCKVCGG
jgi:hypothetical protein